jgi:hypothetical protein
MRLACHARRPLHHNTLASRWAGLRKHQQYAARRTPDSVLISAEEIRQNKQDLNWAFKREQTIAAAAAGVHLLNHITHWMNDQFRYLDHMYAPKHEALYSQFGKW